MRFALGLFLFITLVATANVAAQESAGAAPTVDALRAQLVDLQTKETELQMRARQLEEELKPENIERSLAGFGSTKPEELREQRRRQDGDHRPHLVHRRGRLLLGTHDGGLVHGHPAAADPVPRLPAMGCEGIDAGSGQGVR